MYIEEHITKRRIASSGMLRLVPLVRADVSEELSASIVRVTRISELGTTLAVTSNRRALRINTNTFHDALMMEPLTPHAPIYSVSHLTMPSLRLDNVGALDAIQEWIRKEKAGNYSDVC
jgi:hypothetical protein